MTDFPIDDRNRLRRKPARGSFDRDIIYPIIDEAPICHVGFAENGQPFVIPTLHARHDDTLILHGAKASRLLKHIEAGHPVCVAFTLLDGIVLARSAFSSSVNYRSAVVFGAGRIIDAEDEKMHALELVTNHIVPGRWSEARIPTPKEMHATSVVSITIEQASAKVRSGPPGDEEEDYALPIWAGVLPLATWVGDPVPDPRLAEGIPTPESVGRYVQSQTR